MKTKKRRSQWKALVCAAALTVSANAAVAASIDGYAGPILTPSSLDFGNVVVGTASPAQTVSIEAGYGGDATRKGGTLSITSITLPAGYTLSGGTCPASGAAPNPCTIGVVFTPPALGVVAGNGVITASVNQAPPGTTTLALTGTGVPGALIAVPSLGSLGLLALLATLLGSGVYFARRR